MDPRRTPSDASPLAACSAIMSDLERPSRQSSARQIDLLRRGSKPHRWHARAGDRDRKIRAHLRQLQALGLNVEISEAAV